MNMRSWPVRLGIMLASVASIVPLAHARQEPDAIVRAVRHFVQQQGKSMPGRVEVEITPPDPRLQLAACRHLRVELPAGARLWGHSSVQVRCEAPAWQLDLPVVVHVHAAVVVLTHAVGAGYTLAAQDLGSQEMDLTDLGPDTVLRAADAVGRVTASPVPGGFPLRAQLLRQPYLITVGQPVQVRVQGTGFSLEAEATALGNASVGQRVRLRTQAGKVITGIAEATGMVRVAD